MVIGQGFDNLPYRLGFITSLILKTVFFCRYIYSSSCLYLLSSSSIAKRLAMCRLGRVITTQKVLFYTLINTGFEHFLCSNHPNYTNWHGKDLARLVIKFCGKFGCFRGYIS